MPAQTALQSMPALLGPTIKGIFVNSHVEAVRRAKGQPGIDALTLAFGRPLEFRDLDDVPIREEVRLIECANDVLRGERVAEHERAYEGGRLHYRNFSGTPLARMAFAVFPRNFRYLMLHVSGLAERVFKGVKFSARELGPREIEVTMKNNDYPVDHFRGLFQAWMEDFGYRGVVSARVSGPGEYTYDMRWE